MYTQNSPSSFQTEISPCLPKHIQSWNANSLLLPPPPTWQWPLQEDAGKCPQVDVNQVLLNEFSLWQRSGCKTVARNAGPHKIFFFKETMNLVFVVNMLHL